MKYKHKLFINFVLFISFIEILAISINVYISYQDRLEFLSERASLLAKSQAISLKTSLWNYDKQSIGNILESLLTDPSFIQSEVVHHDNTKVALMRQQKNKNAPAVITVHANIISPKDDLDIIGKLSLSFSSISLKQYILQRLTDNFMEIFILLCFNIALVFLLLKSAIKPLEELSDTLHRISRQDFETEIPLLERHDEIGDIARAANVFKNNGVELSSLQQTLQQRVHEQTKNLSREKRRAQRESRIKSKFLANMSHEIRTPLNAILGFGQLAKASAENEKQKDHLNKIYNSALSLLGIINDILDFSKIEANKLDIEETEFNLKKIANQSLELFIDKACHNNIELLGMIPENIPATMIGDPLRLSQILNNLLSNAIKFTKAGEVVLFIEPGYQDKENIRLNFSIRDTGIGIEPAKINTLFKAFSQADISTTREYGGTGLGLSICRQLISLMGGEIHVESQPGRGSTFSFVLPFNIPQTDLPQNKQQTEPLAYIKVLIINANKQACFIYEEYLRELKVLADCAYSAAEAINLLTHSSDVESAYDYVFVNDFLQDDNIFDIIKQIHSIPHTSNLKIILMTSPYDYKPMQELAAQQHIKLDHILLKPLNREKLINSLQLSGEENLHMPPAEEILWQPAAEHIQRISGAEILLIEDIDINRELVCEILHNWGLKVTTANNGREAINCIKEFQYELVLMDIQMPEIDGFEATQIIREQLKLTQLPIIAMTALAMTGDKDKLLASGMNDYISKPIEIKNLFDTLIKWIKPKQLISSELQQFRKEEINNQAKHGEADSEADIAQLNFIDTDRGLKMLGGNHALYKELLLKLKMRLDNDVAMLPQYFEEQNIEAFQQIIHNIKGISGNLGASGLAREAETLENLSMTPFVVNELNHFMQQCRSLSEELSLLDDAVLKNKTSTDMNTGHILQLLEEIKVLVSGHSFSVSKKMPELHEALNGHCHKIFKLLDEAIGQYDFQQSEVIIQQLLSCIDRDKKIV